MTRAPAAPIEERLSGMVTAICQLITAPDAWLASRDRFALLADLWGAVAQPDLSVDLVLHSSSEATRRAQQPSSSGRTSR